MKVCKSRLSLSEPSITSQHFWDILGYLYAISDEVFRLFVLDLIRKFLDTGTRPLHNRNFDPSSKGMFQKEKRAKM